MAMRRPTPVRLARHRLANGAEVGPAGLVLDADLAIDDEAGGFDGGGVLGYQGVLVGPIQATAGQHSDAGRVLDRLSAIAIVLDLMEPATALGWFVDEGRVPSQGRN